MFGFKWRHLAKALGQKDGNTDQEADKVATLRLIIVTQAIITNVFIVFGVVFNVVMKLFFGI